MGAMGKAALQAWLNALDVWLIIFGVLVAIGAVGGSVAGFLHWRRSGQLQAILEAENLAQQNDIAQANARAPVAQARTADLRIELEKEMENRLGRSLKKEEFDALQQLKGKITKVNIMKERSVEAAIFADQIIVALTQAGLDVKVYFAPPDYVWTGIMIWSPSPENDPLMDAFKKAGLLPGWGNIGSMVYPDVPHDAPLIEIGERFPELKAPYFGPPPSPTPNQPKP